MPACETDDTLKMAHNVVPGLVMLHLVMFTTPVHTDCRNAIQ